MATKTIFSLSLLAFLWATPVLAQKDSLEQSLLTKIPIWMNEHHVPCAGVGIIRDGQIAWIKVFGDLDKGLPAPSNTLFNIASQTKPNQLQPWRPWNWLRPVCGTWMNH
jgi:CubicO group peptidase (beta-lactamase class C family)